MSYLDSLRTRFAFLSFMNDEELENFLSVVRSVSRGVRLREEEILTALEKRRAWNYGNC